MNYTNSTVCIETEIVASEDGNNTYELIKRIKGGEGGVAYIILLYPTRNANNLCSDDSTLNHLVSHMNELHINELHILNLFSKVIDGKMSSRGLQVDTVNLEYIDTTMSDKAFTKAKFIIAWGNSMATSYACKKSKVEILKMFQKNNPKGIVYQLMSSDAELRAQIAPHPLYLGIRGSRSTWSLAELPITKKMLEEPKEYVPGAAFISTAQKMEIVE